MHDIIGPGDNDYGRNPKKGWFWGIVVGSIISCFLLAAYL